LQVYEVEGGQLRDLRNKPLAGSHIPALDPSRSELKQLKQHLLLSIGDESVVKNILRSGRVAKNIYESFALGQSPRRLSVPLVITFRPSRTSKLAQWFLSLSMLALRHLVATVLRCSSVRGESPFSAPAGSLNHSSIELQRSPYDAQRGSEKLVFRH
jgi:hypothetical protein